MAILSHRDMTSEERARVERAAHQERMTEPGWSSHTVAVLILLSGSFVLGILLFGVPALFMLARDASGEVRDTVLFVPGVVTSALGGTWSVVYYVRGSWRVRRELLDDLEYGRVEVLEGTARDAWVVDGREGTTWLLEMGDEVLMLAPSAVPKAPRRTFPGRRLRVVRCKHSGLVLALEVDGPALAPTSWMQVGQVALPEELESARYDGALDEVCRLKLAAA